MGPLTDIGVLNSNWELLIALVLGIGFGYVLEAAGFSTSRKLAGVFYGYDFVVWRVFFTAALTAMVGLMYFSYLDWIDLSLIYVNKTFLGSAIAGGVIMGLGFIIGGFCPGTSVCALAIGKLDALLFLGGVFLGIFLFGATFPMIEEFYTSGALGSILVYDVLGISAGLFVFILILFAIVSFYLTARIQRKAKPVRY
jgi:hypothetical protein